MYNLNQSSNFCKIQILQNFKQYHNLLYLFNHNLNMMLIWMWCCNMIIGYWMIHLWLFKWNNEKLNLKYSLNSNLMQCHLRNSNKNWNFCYRSIFSQDKFTIEFAKRKSVNKKPNDTAVTSNDNEKLV